MKLDLTKDSKALGKNVKCNSSRQYPQDFHAFIWLNQDFLESTLCGLFFYWNKAKIKEHISKAAVKLMKVMK